MSTKKITWFRVAGSVGELDWKSNNMAVIEADGKKITMALHNEQLFAVAYKCPHASGIMADGSIDAAGNIICPLHRYKFNMQNGRNVSGEGYYLKTYLVEVKEEGVFVGMEEKGFLNWL